MNEEKEDFIPDPLIDDFIPDPLIDNFLPDPLIEEQRDRAYPRGYGETYHNQLVILDNENKETAKC